METKEITIDSYEETIIGTMDSQEVSEIEATFYLDHHIKNKVDYYAVCKDENLMIAFDDENEARQYFHKMSDEQDGKGCTCCDTEYCQLI